MAPIPTHRGHWDGAVGSSAVTTAPIPVTAGEFLVVTVEADGASTAPVVWTTAPDWGFTVRCDSNDFSGTDGAYAGCFGLVAAVTANPVVHVTTSGGAATDRRPACDVWTVAGVNPSAPVIQAVGTVGTGGPGPITRAFRSAAGGDGDTLAIICGADMFHDGAPWVTAQGGTPGPGFDQAGHGISGFSTAANWPTRDVYYGITIDPPGDEFSLYVLAYFEISRALLPPDVNAGADGTWTYGTPAFTRTATEIAYSTITSRQWSITAGPTGVGDVIGYGQTLTWSPTVGGAYTLRYTATSAIGSDYDECVITVVGVVPTISAGPDRSTDRTVALPSFSAVETSSGGSPITAREWKIVSTGQVLSTSAVCPPLIFSTAGNYTLRYSATNATGTATDDMIVTVRALRPTVDAGPDEARGMGLVTRTASETAGDNAITTRQWKIQDGPTNVGDVIGSAAALSWTPPSLGRWTLRYTATSAAGSASDDAIISIGVTGVPLRLGRSPEPKIAVSAAFAGDLTDPDGSSWAFTEITTDVRAAQGIHLRHGKGDEASTSQPAQLALVLGNRHGQYSLGGLSPYWPNVRQGTPVRIECDLGDGAGFKIVYTGYADGWTPHYTPRPTSGGEGDATVSLVASGTLRRMSQGQPPVISPMRRGIVNTPGVVAYWPCEDGKGATTLASAFPGAPPMDFSGRLHGGSNPGLPAATPRLAASDTFASSNPLPLVSDSEWYGKVPDYTPDATAVIQTRWLIDVPAAGCNDRAVIMGMISTGNPCFWEVRYQTGGTLNVRAWRHFIGPPVLDVYDIAMAPHPTANALFVGLDGRRGQLGLTLTQNGSAVTWGLDWLEVGSPLVWLYGGSLANATVGRAQRIQTATDGGHVDMTLGHIQVRKTARSSNTDYRHLNAWWNEVVGVRLARLRDENGLWYVQYDPPPPYYPTISDTMGPQPVGTVLDLFRDCETTDQGILWDGVGPGLSYTTKRYREAGVDGRGTPKVVLDAAAGHVALPFEPVHDDAYRVNRAVASRRDGASAVFEDATGPLGSGIVGRYEDSREFGVLGDAALPQYAGWMVGQGTAEGARYPRLSLDLTAHPELLDEWLGIIPGDRVDVVNLHAIHPSAPAEEISLVVEGYEQTIYPTRWTATMNTSLAQRWQVASVAAETIGGAGEARPEYVARVDTDASVIATLTAAGQGTLKVDVSAGPLWTTNADATKGDYPLYLDIGGTRVRATGCTAGGVAGDPANRQTFTIDPMPVTRPAGTAVRLWNPPVYGL